MNPTQIEAIIEQATTAVLRGEVDDSLRVGLYQVAMTVAAAEFHRVESVSPGVVSPESLLLIQQLALLADPNVSEEKLLDNARSLAGDIEGAITKAANGVAEEDPG